VRYIFADTSFFIALLHPRDGLHTTARELYETLDREGRVRLVTSEPVLVEVLTRLAKYGPEVRRTAIKFADDVPADRRFVLVPQTSGLFRAGLDLLRRRPDKTYSMTDCMSMVICGEREIIDVLTADHDFEQERFNILLRR
jgi:predicted nucleic acid-binding protein